MKLEKRKDFKFFKEIDINKMPIIKCFDNGIIEIGDSYVKYHSKESIDNYDKE